MNAPHNSLASNDAARLFQSEFLSFILREPVAHEFVTVYLSDKNGTTDHTISCALIPLKKGPLVLKDQGWDLSLGEGVPGSISRYRKRRETTSYYRFGNDEGFEPLIFWRDFHGVRPSYLEVSEEFRLFHNLHYDGKQSIFTKITDAGNEEVIIQLAPKRIDIRHSALKQFLAIKKMYLSLQFDCREHSNYDLEELGLKEGTTPTRSPLIAYNLSFGDLLTPQKSFSRLLGKKLIKPYPLSKSGFWGFEKRKKQCFEKFIISSDKHGRDIVSNSNPDRLANNFGANKNAPNYLTPVFFRRGVLDKYYSSPSRYSIEDGYLRCAGLWGMTIDNHNDGYIVAWLGDLGRDLPYEEQLHWRSYNIQPIGGPSEIFINRQILAIPTDSDRPDLLFKQQYDQLLSVSEEILGWHILLPLSKEDIQHLECIRLPASEEQKEFDELVLSLAKLLVDSLNEKKLLSYIPTKEKEGFNKGITRLDVVLKRVWGIDTSEHIKFLRDLQELRSCGAVHRKGTNYGSIASKIGLDKSSFKATFKSLLFKALEFLKLLDTVIRRGALSKNPPSLQM
jgi:hypothetical protein